METNIPVPNSARVLIFNQHEEVLIAQRALRCRSNGGIWEFPGGKMNHGEAVWQTAQREAGEELGITPLITETPFYTHTEPLRENPILQHLTHFVVGSANTKVAIQLDPWEVSQAFWIPPRELVLGDFALTGASSGALDSYLTSRSTMPFVA